jgi:cytochrome c
MKARHEPGARAIAVVVLCGAQLLLSACSSETSPAKVDAASVARGEWLSHACTPCHNLQRRTNGIGPHLVGVIGRRAGAVGGYDYSQEMKASHILWTPEAIEDFIQWPLSVSPEGRMALAPVPERDAADIVAYLRSIDQ